MMTERFTLKYLLKKVDDLGLEVFEKSEIKRKMFAGVFEAGSIMVPKFLPMPFQESTPMHMSSYILEPRRNATRTEKSRQSIRWFMCQSLGSAAL